MNEYKRLLEDAIAMQCLLDGERDELEQVKAERDRLASEVALLRSERQPLLRSLFERDSKVTQAEAEVARLTARWERLSEKLRDERLASLDRPVEGYTDGLDGALYMMAALEREEAK